MGPHSVLKGDAISQGFLDSLSTAHAEAESAAEDAVTARNQAEGFRDQASTHATNANTSATRSEEWASKTPGQEVSGGLESSRSYASRAQTSAEQAQQAAQSAWQAPSVGVHGIPELARAAGYGLFGAGTDLSANHWGGSLPGVGSGIPANSGASQQSNGSWQIDPDGYVGLNFQGPPESSDLSIGCVVYGTLEAIQGAHIEIWRDGPGVVWTGWGEDLGQTGSVSQRALIYEWAEGDVPGGGGAPSDWEIRIRNGGSARMSITPPILQPRSKLAIPSQSGQRPPDLVRQTSNTTVTISAGDMGGVLMLTRDGDQTVNLNGGLPVGYRLEVVCAGTGTKFIAPGTGQNIVTLNKDSATGEMDGVGSKATVIPLGSHSYLVSVSPAIDT